MIKDIKQNKNKHYLKRIFGTFSSYESKCKNWSLFKFQDLLFAKEVLGYNGGILIT